MPPPKLISSPETKAYYEAPLRHVMPDLEGYDEIYLIHERDYKNGGIEKLLKQGRMLSVLEEHDPDQYKALKDLLKEKIENPTKRYNEGTGARSLEGGDPDKPFRAGIMLISGETKGLGMMAPPGLSKQQKTHIDSLDDTPRKQQERNWIVFNHEAGHLVRDIKDGIPLLHEARYTLDSVHPAEVASDDYAGKINGKMAAAGELKNPGLYNSMMNIRAISGGRLFTQGEFSPHFTAPFIPGGSLATITTQEAAMAASGFGQSIDADLMKRLSSYYKDNRKTGALDVNVGIVRDAIKQEKLDPTARQIGKEYVRAVDEEFKNAPAPALK